MKRFTLTAIAAMTLSSAMAADMNSNNVNVNPAEKAKIE